MTDLLTVEGLRVHFFTKSGVAPVVDGIDFTIVRAKPLDWWVSPAAARQWRASRSCAWCHRRPASSGSVTVPGSRPHVAG